jgi:hypothetical protein
MKSRLRSLRRLLDKFNDVMSAHELDSVYDEINALEKSISRLNVYATMEDCVIRTANKFKAIGFDEGADFLTKVAEGEDVVESLPAPVETPQPDLPQGGALVSLQTVISRLEGVSKMLKSRDAIRELASIDILLNELGLASYFPELTDAQAKLIESFGYASNKIESIVAKLRGTSKTPSMPAGPKTPPMPKAPEAPMPMPGVEMPAAKPKPEPIRTEEVAEKPVGTVERKLPTE